MNIVTLTEAMTKAARAEIVSIDDDDARIKAMRFGLGAGAVVSCVVKIPAGPIVVKSARQEIALGRNLANRIMVRKLA